MHPHPAAVGWGEDPCCSREGVHPCCSGGASRRMNPYCIWGVHQGGASGAVCIGGASGRYVHPGDASMLQRRGVHPGCTLLPVNSMAHACKNITFPQLRLRVGIKVLNAPYGAFTLPDTDTDTDSGTCSDNNGFSSNLQNFSHCTDIDSGTDYY